MMNLSDTELAERIAEFEPIEADYKALDAERRKWAEGTPQRADLWARCRELKRKLQSSNLDLCRQEQRRREQRRTFSETAPRLAAFLEDYRKVCEKHGLHIGYLDYEEFGVLDTDDENMECRTDDRLTETINWMAAVGIGGCGQYNNEPLC